MIDSLTPYLLSSTSSAVFCQLHRLSKDPQMSEVVAVAHRDVHDVQVLAALEHLSQSCVMLQESPLGRASICQVRHCRSSGKVFKTLEMFTLDDSLHISAIQPFQPTSAIDTSDSTPASQAEPLGDVPFRLSLNDAERQARSQLVLPHTQVQSVVEAESE